MTALAVLGSTVGFFILARLATMLLHPSERPRSLPGFGLLYAIEALTVVLVVGLWR
jgi:hypothetical protein